jgi:hypothetical protein
MLITFKSKSSAEIVMYKTHISAVLEAMGKNCDRGVITGNECKAVLQRMEEEIQTERINRKELTPEEEDDLDEYEKKKISTHVSLSARLYPLIEMCKVAQSKNEDIVWGV